MDFHVILYNIFMNLHDFQARVPGNPIGNMHRVSVLQPCGIFYRQVMLQSQRAIDDFVSSVIVHIRHCQVVVALAGILFSGLIGVKLTSHLNLVAHTVPVCIHQVIGCQTGSGIVAAAEHRAGSTPVQISHTGQETVHTSAVAVSPAAHCSTAGVIVHCIDFRTVVTVIHGEILRAGQHIARTVRVVVHIPVIMFCFSSQRIRGQLRIFHCSHMAGIGQRLVRSVGAGVHGRAVSGFYCQLRLAVPVKIPHQELGIVRAGSQVHAHVQTPFQRNGSCGKVYVISVNKGGSCIALFGIILRIGGIPLYKQLQLPVSVQVAHGHIIGGIAAGSSVRHGLVGRLIQLQFQILILPNLGVGSFQTSRRISGTYNFIHVIRCSRFIHQVRYRYIFCDSLAVAVYRISRGAFPLKTSPAQVNAAGIGIAVFIGGCYHGLSAVISCQIDGHQRAVG